MKELAKEDKKNILNHFGKRIVEEVRDRALNISMDIAKNTTRNPVKQKQYSSLQSLTEEQQEAVCDLLSETVTDVIYRFLEMFEYHEAEMKLILIRNGENYDVTDLSEKMGSEIACYEDEGWIQQFSKIGRFVL